MLEHASVARDTDTTWHRLEQKMCEKGSTPRSIDSDKVTADDRVRYQRDQHQAQDNWAVLAIHLKSREPRRCYLWKQEFSKWIASHRA